MKKKFFTTIVCLLLVSALFISACGKSNGDTAGDDTATPGTEQTTDQGGSEQSGGETDNGSAGDDTGFLKASDPSLIPAAAKARTDTIIVGMQNTSGIFNPAFYDTAYDAYVIDTIFESLNQYGKDATLEPGLATWEISEDGLTYTFHIDPKATFSDGTPVTAEDVEFTFKVFLDPSYDGRADLTVPRIVGTDAYKNGDADSIEGIKIIDEKTIQITVEEVKATTLAYLGVPVLSKNYYGKNFKKGDLSGVKALNDKPFGSGPYVFKEYIPGQEVRLEANPNYWKGPAKIKNLVFKATTDETNMQMLQTGETDFEEGISVNKDNMDALEAMGFVDRSLLLNNGYGYIAINHDVAKFQDKRVRQALTYGLNREDVVFAYSQGFANVIDVPQSKLSWAYPDESKITHYNYDPEKAKQLLDEAGWKLESDGYRYKDGEKFTIQFSASTPNPVNDALVPIMKENYKELGIEVVAEQLEFGAVVDKMTAGNYEMAFLAVSLDADPDPYGLFHTNGGSNNYNYSNPEVDKLIEQGQKELDQNKRKEIYGQLYQILNDDLPVIYMYQRYNLNVINARLQGFDISPYKDFSKSIHQVEIVNQ